MASSSCGIHLCTDEEGLCAFIVNEMLNQMGDMREAFMWTSVSVFVHMKKHTGGVCVCARETVRTCTAGQV